MNHETKPPLPPFTDNRIAVRFASINDLPIAPAQRLFHWALGRRPDDHAGLDELGL